MDDVSAGRAFVLVLVAAIALSGCTEMDMPREQQYYAPPGYIEAPAESGGNGHSD